MATNKRSPITDNPLRAPGQSLTEEITRIIDDEVLPYLLMVAMAVALAALEWWRIGRAHV